MLKILPDVQPSNLADGAVAGADVIAIPLFASAAALAVAPEPGCEASSAGRADEFIAGPENRLVAGLVMELLASGEQASGQLPYSPITLCGPSGCGKTMLARGLAAAQPGALLVDAADYVRELAQAIDTFSVDDFRERYRSAAMLVLDNLSDLAERQAAQRELLHTLDVLELNGAQVIVTSRKPPAELADLLPGLRSRLMGGLVVPLSLPAAAARCAMVERFAASHEVEFEPGAVQMLAEQITGPAAELHGAVSELLAAAMLAKSIARGSIDAQPVVSLQQVQEYCQSRRVRLQPQVSKVTSVVAKHFGVKPTKLVSASRSRQVALARSVAIYLCRQLTGQSLQKLGKQFGGRDHSTVLYSCRTLESRLASDPDLRSTVSTLQMLLGET